jgi:hypothetical protein
MKDSTKRLMKGLKTVMSGTTPQGRHLLRLETAEYHRKMRDKYSPRSWRRKIKVKARELNAFQRKNRALQWKRSTDSGGMSNG